ncbi:hypothetical protein F5883DRAFT_350576, partial [Diaporthe sp. PMI_573]
SRGRVLGATLTLDRQQANFLIAFTASFVVLIGPRFWRIVCLFLHQIYSTSEPRDALHHQRQVLLRNMESPESGLLKFVNLFYAWRKPNLKAAVRIAPALLLAVLSTVAFTVAGGFSSQVQFGNDEVGSAVLLDGSNCGIINVNTSFREKVEVGLAGGAAKLFDGAGNYVKQCYLSNRTGETDCNLFILQRL